jgi:hypothetical protein
MPGKKMSRRILWADLLKRTFGIEVLPCSRYKNRTSLVGVVRDPHTIQVTLTATSGFVSHSDGTSTNHHTYIDGNFYQDP